MAQRFAAYKTALDSNFMQIDEVRYAEDLEPLGLNWIKLGLQDVLYNPKTKELFTPNTGITARMDEKKTAPESEDKKSDEEPEVPSPKTDEMPLQNVPEDNNMEERGVPLDLELRYNHSHGPDGRFASTLSAKGENAFQVKGFVSKQKRNNHWQNERTHQAEYSSDGIATKEQYVQRAVALVQSACSDTVDGYKTIAGQICRYDMVRNDFVKGHPSKGIYTMFKPADGKAYFERMKEIEGITTDE